MGKFAILSFVAISIFIMLMIVYYFVKESKKEKDNDYINSQNEKEVKGFINKMNHSDLVASVGKRMKDSDLEKIFNRAKNPWKMTIATFQFIRYVGFLIMLIISMFVLMSSIKYGILSLVVSFLFIWYPKYYYKSIGDEREDEWNKMYEFIWVIKHNVMMYDPAKAFLNTKLYIEQHASHNKEIIQGFDDFYRYWNKDEIDPYIQRYYSAPVPREIFQIVYNMNKTGEFPESTLNALRKTIINRQNLAVEKVMTHVSSKATISSLPFLLASVILALMVPLMMELVQFMGI